MFVRCPARTLVHTLASLAVLVGTAGAQVVQGRVRDASSGRPLDGAVVTLISQPNGVGISVFSDSSGSFRVRAARAGAHRVEIKRIGYTPVVTASFDVSPATATPVPEVSLTPRPQIVATVDIAADQQCRANPSDGRGAVGLWEDVRAALEATVITASEQRYTLRYTSFRRRLDERLREVERQSEAKIARGAMVWASIPADQLAREGYIVSERDGVTYRGLDAHVLLSNSFLESHCFKSAPKHPTNDSLVGLAFQPVRRGDRIDVAGVLWLNRASRELDAIDFTYEGLAVEFPTRDLGGRIEFDQLPSGRWIVDRWHIRMPRVEQRQVMNAVGRAPGRLAMTLVGFDEVGGVVSDIATAALDSRPPVRRPVIRGTVFDSASGGPLIGATISLRDSTRTATTDERGFFSLDSVPEAGVSLIATHPFLDSLGVGSWSWRVEGQSLTRTVSLAVPSLPRLLARVCRETRLPTDAGVLTGIVTDSTRLMGGLPVRVSWTVTSVSAAGVKRLTREAIDTTASSGRFTVCGVPTETALRVELIVPGQRSDAVAFRIAETRRWGRLDIRVSR